MLALGKEKKRDENSGGEISSSLSEKSFSRKMREHQFWVNSNASYEV